MWPVWSKIVTTIQDLADIKLNSIDEGCRHLGRVLGLDEAVSPAVLISAVSSEEYARNLLTCRKEPAFLQHLLDNPVRTTPKTEETRARSVEMLKTASLALARWSKVGFSIASEDVIETRLRACLGCPHIRQTSSSAAAYKLMKTRATCGLCGCDVEKKARMTSEKCPGGDPKAAGYNRWGQPI
jgi:hypothetical protein